MSTTTATGERLYSYERHFDPNNSDKKRLKEKNEFASFVIGAGNQQSPLALGEAEAGGNAGTNSGQGGNGQHHGRPSKTDEVLFTNGLTPLDNEDAPENYVFMASIDTTESEPEVLTDSEEEGGDGVTATVNDLEQQKSEIKMKEDEFPPVEVEVDTSQPIVIDNGDAQLTSEDRVYTGDDAISQFDMNGDDRLDFQEISIKGGRVTNNNELASLDFRTSEYRLGKSSADSMKKPEANLFFEQFSQQKELIAA